MSLLRSFFRPWTRTFSTGTNEVTELFTNRNPRNLEKLRIAYKPDGYHVDKKGRSYWHKYLQIIIVHSIS